MNASELTVEYVTSMSLIPANEWDELIQHNGESDNPFICHAYLWALEKSGCVCEQSGWIPMHITVKHQGKKVAVMPLYNKLHSYGEYIFDWAWADAYQRNQIPYYPKLLSAIPFTPVTGIRLGIARHLTEQQSVLITDVITQTLNTAIQKGLYSSWHCLFLPREQQQVLAESSLARTSNQFHWQNRDYQHFNDFLAEMNSRKRKNIVKERLKSQSKGYQIRFVSGEEITPAHWQAFYTCYQRTYEKRSGHNGYLNLAFFKQIGQTMPDQVKLLIVEKRATGIVSHGALHEAANINADSISEEATDTIVAAALYFTSKTHLYGRYWGCLEEADALHFEACYYQGIEYCIEHGLQVFDAGAQGEHKIARGFEPVTTYSNHQIAHPAFREAIEAYLLQETEQNRRYMTEATKLLPFKETQSVP